MFPVGVNFSVSPSEQVIFYCNSLEEHNVSDANTTASAAHKEAAAEHTACAHHHMKAASCHDDHKIDEARVSSKSAMSCCDTASKKSSAACGCSAKE